MAAKRTYGTGRLYVKSGAYYGRWRAADGRRMNRRIGAVRPDGSRDGVTKSQAEAEFRRLREREDARPASATERGRTVDQAADSLRRVLAVDGARTSYLQNCASMQRVHISAALGTRPLERVTVEDVERIGTVMRGRGLSPKSVRNVLAFLYSVFEHAIHRGWCIDNPARRASRPKRRRAGDAAPDLQFLDGEELDDVLRAIPDEVVVRAPSPTRRGRPGPAPPPPPDVLGPAIRVCVLTAAMSGLRQSELLGLRWRDIDWTAQRIRVRMAYVRGEHSSEGKSDLSTRRSVPMTDHLAGELHRWSTRTPYNADDDLVFAHPQSGRPLDRTKLTRRFQDACREAGVRVIRFHDLRHTFGTRLAAAGVPLRTIQEFLGHADSKTTQIYAHYAPSAREVEMVNAAFAARSGLSPEDELEAEP